jgi:hypothetical protein
MTRARRPRPEFQRVSRYRVVTEVSNHPVVNNGAIVAVNSSYRAYVLEQLTHPFSGT